MKRLIAAIAALILVISVIPSAAFAAGGPQAIMSNASAKAGDTVTLKVKLAGFPEFQSGSFELTSLPEGITLKEGTWLDDGMLLKDFNKDDMRGVFSLASKGNLNKDLLKLTFEVGTSAKAGKNEIKFAMKFMGDDGGFISNATMQNGVITVKSDAAPTDTPDEGETTEPDADEPDGEEPTDTDPVEEPADDTPEGEEPTEGDKPDGEEPEGEEPTDTEPTDEPTDGKTENKKLGPFEITLISVFGAIALAAVVYFVVKLTKKKE